MARGWNNGRRMGQAHHKGYGTFVNCTLKIKLLNQIKKQFYIESYIPAAKGRGQNEERIKALSEEASTFIRQAFREFEQKIKDHEGVVKVSVVIHK